MFYKILLAVLCAATAGDVLAQGIVFRYLPGRPDLSSEVVTESVDGGPFLDIRELPARGPGGWGMAAPHMIEFEGSPSTIRSTATGAINQALGPQLTAEVWVRADDVDGRVVLLTNRVGETDGFTLGLDEARPFFELDFAGSSYRIEAPEAVPAGVNRWLAATVRRSGSVLALALYVDGHRRDRLETEGTFPVVFPIAQPFYVGTEAAGDASAPDLSGSLTGQLFSAVVRAYVADAAYLNSSLPQDGSTYLGLPAFHDYPLSENRLPMDQRISPGRPYIQDRFFVPYVNDAYIPQGTATRFEVTGQDTTALVYVSYYHRARTGPAESKSSIVAEIDALSGHVRRAFRLTGRLGNSHAGGIAYSHDAVFISSAGYIERYLLPAWEGPEGPKYYTLEADTEGSMNVQSKSSYVSAYQDTLWIGDWRPANDVAPYLYAYALDSDGRPQRGVQPKVYAIPRNIQGVDLYTTGGETYIFMSRNRSSTEAEVLRFRRSALDPYFIAAPDTSVRLPHGIEDVSFFPDGRLWTNSESGTEYYQVGPPSWSIFYPFVYSVRPDELFPGFSTVGRESSGLPKTGMRLESYPNPFRDEATVTVTLSTSGPLRVSVVDVTGRTVAVLVDGYSAGGLRELHWNAASVPAGVYFVVADQEGRRVVRAVSRL